MAPYAALIPELEQAIQRGSAARRADIAERVTDLFIDVAPHTDRDQVDLFDHVLGRLVEKIETPARAGISRRLAPVGSAPVGVVRQLARDGDIEVAGPVLRGSPRLADSELAAIARRMGPSHLLAIAQRPVVAERISDILVQRGDPNVLQAVAANSHARLSDLGFAILVRRAAGDDALAETVGRRPDIPAEHLHRLVEEATEFVRRRLAAKDTQGEIGQALANLSDQINARAAVAYRRAQHEVLALVRAEKLGEPALVAFASNGLFDETVAGLSALSRLPIAAVEHILRGDRLDALLIVGRATGLEWTTVKAIIGLRGTAKGHVLDEAKMNFERLARQGALRVVRFWHDRARNKRTPT